MATTLLPLTKYIENKFSGQMKDQVKKNKIFTKNQELADQIYLYFEKRLKFPRIMAIIKQKGYQAIYEIFNEVKHSDAENKISLFIWKVKKEKIIF